MPEFEFVCKVLRKFVPDECVTGGRYRAFAHDITDELNMMIENGDISIDAARNSDLNVLSLVFERAADDEDRHCLEMRRIQKRLCR